MITLAYIASAFAVIIVVGTLSAWAYDALEARLAAHRPARDRRGARSRVVRSDGALRGRDPRRHGVPGRDLDGRHALRGHVDRGLGRARHAHGRVGRGAARAVRTAGAGAARAVPLTLVVANGRALRRS